MMEVVYFTHTALPEEASLNPEHSVKENDQSGYETELQISPSVHLEEARNAASTTTFLTGDKDSGNTVLVPLVPDTSFTSEVQPGALKCNICSKSFSRQSGLRVHLRVHTGEKPLACHECGKCFSDASSLSRHKRIHGGERPHKCSTCGKTFSQKAHLRTHLSSVHSDSRPFRCETCQATFTTLYSLRRHMLVHTGEKPLTCDQCGRSFRSSSSLIIHTRTHTGKKPFTCQVCHKSFADSSALKNHAIVHSGEKRFTCKICNHKLSSRWSLKKHIGAKHQKVKTGAQASGQPELLESQQIPVETVSQDSLVKKPVPANGKVKAPYQCSVCSKNFPNVSNLKRHIRIHNGERPFACNVCDKTFRQNTHLKTHVRTHLDDAQRSKCPQCHKDFSDSYCLKRHMKMHSGDGVYKCSPCGASFPNHSSWKTHQRRHTGERPFQCTYCQQKFSYSCVLMRHIRSHTGEKPYPCEKCDLSFTDSWTRKKHMQKHTDEKLILSAGSEKSYSHTSGAENTCPVCQQTFDMEWRLKLHAESCGGNGSTPSIKESASVLEMASSHRNGGCFGESPLSGSQQPKDKGCIRSCAEKTMTKEKDVINCHNVESSETPADATTTRVTVENCQRESDEEAEDCPGMEPRDYGTLTAFNIGAMTVDNCADRRVGASTTEPTAIPLIDQRGVLQIQESEVGDKTLAASSGISQFDIAVGFGCETPSSEVSLEKVSANPRGLQNFPNEELVDIQNVDCRDLIHNDLSIVETDQTGRVIVSVLKDSAHPIRLTNRGGNSDAIHHEDCDTFKCSVCGKTFTLRLMLQLHQETTGHCSCD